MATSSKRFHVYGHNTADGGLHLWGSMDRAYAENFAKTLCETNGGDEVLILEEVGRWKKVRPPVVVEYVGDELATKPARKRKAGKP